MPTDQAPAARLTVACLECRRLAEPSSDARCPRHSAPGSTQQLLAEVFEPTRAHGAAALLLRAMKYFLTAGLLFIAALYAGGASILTALACFLGLCIGTGLALGVARAVNHPGMRRHRRAPGGDRYVA